VHYDPRAFHPALDHVPRRSSSPVPSRRRRQAGATEAHRRPAAPRRRADATVRKCDDIAREAMEITLELLRRQGLGLLRNVGRLSRRAAGLRTSTVRVAAAFVPLTGLLAREGHITPAELGRELDRLFEALYQHPLTARASQVTRYLRQRKILPNEETTESLIRFVVEQAVARSPVPVPQQIIDEFWTFFHELMSEPELRGLAELGLDIVRLVLRTYEPLLAEVVNELKDIVYSNQDRVEALLRRVRVVRGDLQILRRQIKALRHIRPYFQADPRDFQAQARIVARMVREFGPFFVKMAQVAAASADFLPEEIARELAVFQEDVAPMTAQEARDAIVESFGEPPEKLYFDFDPDRPLKSGSIGSVYLARKPMTVDGEERLVTIVVKIARHNLDREFLMGKTSIGLMLLSSHYWAPHGKLTPFLNAMSEQVDTFIDGFRGELEFTREAEVQSRFWRRARHSTVWRVPRVYRAGERVVEMEYIEGAVNIARATAHFAPRNAVAYRRGLARRFLYAVMTQVLVHRELHGDLHPGNVMVDARGRLHLIDWGNSIGLVGKFVPVTTYLRAALTADPDALTDALILVSVDPEAAQARRTQIRQALLRTLEKKGVRPLTLTFPLTLYGEGVEGLLRRANLTAQLMSNAQNLGLVVHSDYLHLSRSLAALVGTLGSLYKDVPRHLVLADLLFACNSFPALTVQEALRGKGTDIAAAVVGA
jgi:predicted unusual protein kinase regulating ubiquinone biosynthesis (AarF/ABC1/UbiB family)